jgi:hypothetical protein
MENTATIEVHEERRSAASAPPVQSGGRTIDGFFRSRTTTVPRGTVPAPASNSIATLATPNSSVPSAPEVRPRTAPAKHTSRNVNHTQAHTPQIARVRTIEVSHAAAPQQELTVHRGLPNHVRHRAIQRSRTLRRDAVPAPMRSTHNLLSPKSAIPHKVPGLIATKKSADRIDPDRLARASSTARSPLVARHALHGHPIVPTFASLAVQPMPTPAAPPVAPPPTPGNDGVPPAPAPQYGNKPASGNGPADMFEHALANANNFVDLQAHKARYRKKARVHVASMLAGSLALIVVATVIAYQNSPAMQLKVATVKAGVNAYMPNFAAAGFRYNGVHAGDSKLTFGFKGTTGAYQLTQTNTNLSDADMIQNIGSTDASGTPIYQIVLAGNTVVYRFSNTNATWVSNGKWYTVSGTNALTNQQVQSIVQHV